MNTPDPASGVSRTGVLIRVGMFVLLGYLGLHVYSLLLSPLGYLPASVLSTFFAGITANVLALRIHERAAVTSIGLYWTKASRRNLGIGLCAGALAASVILGPALVVGWAEIVAEPDPSAHLGTFGFVTLVLLFGALAEEVLFRGYAFQALVPVFGKWATVLPMAVLFGAAHAGNLSASRLSVGNTIAWGALLGYAVLRSGDLWLAIGLHFGWNWMLPVFGVSLSGFTIKVTGWSYRWKIGELWSGGEYGPEAGLLCTLVLIALVIALERAPVLTQRLPLTESGKQL
jgi:hypothetical protein